MQDRKNKRIALILIFLITVLFIPVSSFAATYDDAETIEYTTDSGEEVTFDERDFYDACDDVTGHDLNYIKFTSLPSGNYGTLYYDYDPDENSDEVSTSDKYYYDTSQYLSKVSFVPEDDYEGTVTVRYTGYDENGDTYDGRVKITVSAGDTNDAADDITYSIDGDETLTFDKDDFNDACNDLNDEDLDSVKFSLPSSSAGTLYYNYKSEDDYDSKVSTSKYYYDESPYLSKVTFVPKEDYSGTVTIRYTGYDAHSDSFTGKIKISVEDAASSVIAYSVDKDETVTFDEDDFYEICDGLNDEVLDYVTFTLPSDTKGILYYSYKSSGSYDSKVTASKKYYYDDSPYLSKVTFVPAKGFSGICTISFKGYDTDGVSFNGTVEITINGELKTANTISYSSNAGSYVYFREDDFNNVCKKITDNSLEYVKFTLPSAASGKLYYGYTSAKNYTSEVSASSKYYYGSTPFILNVAYVPASGATGTTVINYTGYDSEGAAFAGKVQITIGGTTVPTDPNLKKSKYFSDVDEAYSWAVDYIDRLYQDGIANGSTGDDGRKHYYPASKIKRGEFMLLLTKALNIQTNTSSGNFSDVAKSEYYYDAIATAKALGIAQGAENKFYPNSTITREDAMVLALRAMNKSGQAVTPGDVSSLSSYSDNYVIDSYARDAIATLIKAGIITGSDDNKIHPMEGITRIQAAAIIYRIKY